MAKKKSKKKAKAVVSDGKLSGFKKHKKKTIVTAVIVVLIVIALLFLFKSGTPFRQAKSETESTRAELVLDEITCLYLGDTPKYGHLGKYFGNVDNVGDAIAENVKIIVEFYDNGNLVGTHETTVVGDNIDPGDKGAFFSYTEGLEGSFSTCKAKVE